MTAVGTFLTFALAVFLLGFFIGAGLQAGGHDAQLIGLRVFMIAVGVIPALMALGVEI